MNKLMLKNLFLIMILCGFTLPNFEVSNDDKLSPNDHSIEATMKVNASPYVEQGGWVVMEAENTPSNLGFWKKKTSVANYKGKSHLEFNGNSISNGPPKSPLAYTFKITTAGQYRLIIRAHRRLTTDRTDYSNDGYLRMVGDFQAGSGATLKELKENQKFFGGRPDKWGVADKYDIDNSHKFKNAVYKFKAGKTYTLYISGRSKFWNIDRIMIYDMSKHSFDKARDQIHVRAESSRGGGGGNPQPPANEDPTANAGNDFSVTVGGNGKATFDLNGSGSDSDGSISSYQWKEGSNTLGNTKKVSVTKSPGTYTFTLQVTDNDGAKDTDNVKVTVKAKNSDPDPDPDPTPNPGGTSVNITAPSANQQFVKGQKIAISAKVTKLGNNKVQFFKANSLLRSFTGGDKTYTFSFNSDFQKVVPKSPIFYVKIVNGSGKVLAEDQVQVTILPKGSTPGPDPTPNPGGNSVNITSPKGGTTFTKGAKITITAKVTSKNGKKVQFFKANSLLKTISGGNGTFTYKFNSSFQKRTPSSPTFTVKVLDASNKVLAEDQVQVKVNPASSISAPVIGAQSRNIQPDTQAQIEVTNLYPNVVKTNELNVVLSESVKNATFAIRDAQGFIIKEGSFELGVEPLLKINLDQNLPSGLYFLEIRGANGTTQTKFIKE